MTYLEKKAVANKYLNDKAQINWDSLPDINSLHDVDDVESIEAACDERLDDEGFFNFID